MIKGLVPINLPQRIRELETLRSKIAYQLGKTLYKVAKDSIIPESQKRVPVDTGALRSTAKAHPPKRDGNNPYRMIVDMTYGGYAPDFNKDVEYAVLQHYALHFYHPKGGQALYLQTPAFVYYGFVLPEELNSTLLGTTLKTFKP